MSIQEKFEQFLTKYPQPHVPFYNRPYMSRRRFFEVIGAGVTGSYLVQRSALADTTVVTPALPESRCAWAAMSESFRMARMRGRWS